MTQLSAQELKKFDRLQLFRALTLFFIFNSICQLFNLGIQPLLFGGFAAFGVLRAGTLLKKNASLKKILIEVFVLALATYFLPTVLSTVLKSIGVVTKDNLVGVVIADTVLVLGCALVVTLISTLLFWRFKSHLTVEGLIFIALSFSLVSGHRNYQLDAPKELSQLAWKLGVEPQNFFIGLGVLLCIFVGFFLVSASSRPIFGQPARSTNVGAVGKWTRFAFPLLLFVLLIGYARYVSSKYEDNLSRASEGVGEGSEEGKSPLGFHSAVGKTSQPAALIRFDGDYKSNPWEPMLYIREGALSSYNGKEMVIASRDYDTDVPRISPGQPYLAMEKEVIPTREEVNYSVFLLAEHKTAIAIDYPKSIRPIKNPDPNRFSASYQVLSIAPKIKLDALSGEEFGDPSWTPEIRQHYLRAPGDQNPEGEKPNPTSYDAPVLDTNGEDLRYRALSQELTAGLQSPFEKTSAIINYLSKNSIYTRQPGHKITEGGDPVAPYLFADEKRGYCVHFAHAAVYLLRLAGIPARIGTGYLTDLNYAKDGHILLNMGDRHAWPEVFINGLGWMVFDIQPAHAENETVQPPDEKLLEELMSKLDALGELTPPVAFDTPNPGNSFGDQIIDRLSDRLLYIRLIAIILILFVLTKIYMRIGYRFTTNPKKKAVRGYLAIASNFCDLGNPRQFGETKLEYLERLKSEGKVRSVKVSEFCNESNYSTLVTDLPSFTANDVSYAVEETKTKQEVLKRVFLGLIAFISPLSILRWGSW